jgi:hypothetical protein
MIHEIFHVLGQNTNDEESGCQCGNGCPAEPPQSASCDLSNGDVSSFALIAIGGKTWDLHEVEVVQQANPGNTGKDVKVPKPEVM